jgi:hypothetical protein
VEGSLEEELARYPRAQLVVLLAKKAWWCAKKDIAFKGTMYVKYMCPGCSNILHKQFRMKLSLIMISISMLPMNLFGSCEFLLGYTKTETDHQLVLAACFQGHNASP